MLLIASSGCGTGRFFYSEGALPHVRAGTDAVTGAVYKDSEEREKDRRVIAEKLQNSQVRMPTLSDLFPSFGWKFEW